MSTIRPNIVLIMTDQQRYDSLGVHGNRIVATPNLDDLAARSATFDHFYVTNPICVPSRASFLTGRYPMAHRARDLDYQLGRDEAHLPGILREAGYDLALTGKNHVLSAAELATFNHVFEVGHQKAPVASAQGSWGSGVDPTPLAEYPTTVVCDRALEFLESRRNADRPFFHWISFPDPHTPYQAPEPYASMYDPEQIPLPETAPAEWPGKPLGQQLVRQLQGQSTEQQVRQMIAKYYGMVSCVDHAVGRVLDTLADLGLAEDTIVVFTSDHGDYLGEHGLARKSWHFYDSLLHVPFILSWPGRITAQRVRDTMAENVDLLPTLLDLVDLPVPTGNQGLSAVSRLDGRGTIRDSVFAYAGNPGETRKVSSVEEWHARGESSPYWWAIGAVQGCMIRMMDRKLCLYVDGEAELYDLVKDPGELRNLYGRSEMAATERELMRDLMIARLSKEDPRPPDADRFRVPA